MGLRATAVRPEVETTVAAGLPVAVYDFAFVRQIRRPLLVVQGERDNFGSEPELRAAATSWSEHVRLSMIPGADHFFAEHLPQLRGAVVGFLKDDGNQ